MYRPACVAVRSTVYIGFLLLNMGSANIVVFFEKLQNLPQQGEKYCVGYMVDEKIVIIIYVRGNFLDSISSRAWLSLLSVDFMA